MDIVSGTLYLVGTPIGEFGGYDVSGRSRKFAKVDTIAASTRQPETSASFSNQNPKLAIPRT
jgi:16S rRNA C1402 (ribose-2'-O) methylase RsmI